MTNAEHGTTHTRVLDAWAVLAWLQGEPAGARVRAMIQSAATGSLVLHFSIVNAGEAFYLTARRGGLAAAQAYWSRLLAIQPTIRLAAATNERVEQAARVKASHPISYADAFAVALARELSAPVVTGDPELNRLAHAGLLTVDWLGSAGRA